VSTLKRKLGDVDSHVQRAEARLAKAKAAAAKKLVAIQTAKKQIQTKTARLKRDTQLEKAFQPKKKNIGQLETADLKVAHQAFTHEFKEFEHDQKIDGQDVAVPADVATADELAVDTVLLTREYSIAGR